MSPASSHTLGRSVSPRSDGSSDTAGRSGNISPQSSDISDTNGRSDEGGEEKEDSDSEDEGDVFAQSYREGSSGH
jgi:hypothetical protein